MKKKIIYTMVLCSLLTLISCELEMSGNGKLDGFWHVEAIDTLKKDGKIKPGNKKDKKLFWSFQYKLLQLDDRDYKETSCLLRFSREKDTLTVYDPYKYNREQGDEKLNDATLLKPYGINSIKENFIVKELTSSKMTLKKDSITIKLRKF